MIKYIVLEEQRKVIAKLVDCEMDVVGLISRKTGVQLEHEGVLLKHSYKAVAKCHPEDEFNVEEGKKIAKEKLMQKYNIAFNKALANATDFTYFLYESVSSVEDRYIR